MVEIIPVNISKEDMRHNILHIVNSTSKSTTIQQKNIQSSINLHVM